MSPRNTFVKRFPAETTKTDQGLPAGYSVKIYPPLGTRLGRWRRGRQASVQFRGKQIGAFIQVDNKGNIDEDTAILRLMDAKDGDRKGRQRNLFVDLAVLADTVATAKPKTERDRLAQYLWWIHPNESDMAGIDTPDAHWLPPKEHKTRAAVAIIGTPDERAAVAHVLNSNFTNHERRMLKGLSIEVKPRLPPGLAGYYQTSQMAPGSTGSKVVIGKGYVFRKPDAAGPAKDIGIDDAVITHEIIHHLRVVDKSKRQPTSRGVAAGHRSMEDYDLNEVFTESEAQARIRQSPSSTDAGYHQFLKEADLPVGVRAGHPAVMYDREILRNLYLENPGAKDVEGARDRIPRYHPIHLLAIVDTMRTGGWDSLHQTQQHDALRRAGFKSEVEAKRVFNRIFKGKKGVNAIKIVEAQLPNMVLSKLRVKGKVEAIDTYWSYMSAEQRERTLTQVYSPKADGKRVDAKAIAKMAPGGQLYEYQDGKRVRVA